MSEAVWITGVGAVTAGGPDRQALARLLADGGTAVRPVASLGGRLAGAATESSGDRAARRLDRSARLFRLACQQAWRGAGLDGLPAPRRAGLVEGSSLGPLAGVLEDHAESLADPRERNRPGRLTRFMTGAGGAFFAQEVGILGPVLHLSAGSVSATCAIGEAFQRLAAGALDLAVAGGAECPLHPEIVGTFAAAGVLARGGEHVPCRPFDRRRAGTVLGEGAAAFVLEAASHARSRGAIPLARITGYGFCTEAYDLIRPDPSGCGAAEAALAALRMAPPRRVGWVKAHGTGTPAGDAAELHALATVFGAALADLPVASLKSTLGHCLGASGAIELAATVGAIVGGFVPANFGFEESDPALPTCSLSGKVRPSGGGGVLFLSESFGGRCAALVVEGV
jgi:3-oxoacyl-(acyl-carrier-protein) synthase